MSAPAGDFLEVLDAALAEVRGKIASRTREERAKLEAGRARARREARAYLASSWRLLVEGIDLKGRSLDIARAAYRDHLREQGVDERDVRAAVPPGLAA